MGLPAEVVEAIRVGKPPTAMEKDVAAVYNFATEFITTRAVSDATLTAAKAVLGGDRGVVDLVGTMGLYQISSMMVVARPDAAGERRQAVLPRDEVARRSARTATTGPAQCVSPMSRQLHRERVQPVETTIHLSEDLSRSELVNC